MDNEEKIIPMDEEQITPNELARMMQAEFISLNKTIKERFDGIDKTFDKVAGDIRLLQTGQDDIKMRLDSKANRMDHEALEERVEKLELQQPQPKFA